MDRSSDRKGAADGFCGPFLTGDLDDHAELPRVFASARGGALVNLASLGFGHAPAIVAAARAAGLDRAVFVSTTAVTTSLPSRSKRIRLEAERHIRDSGLAWTILRPTMIYGAAGDRNLSRLLRALTFHELDGHHRALQPAPARPPGSSPHGPPHRVR